MLSLSEANDIFIETIKEEFCNNGYFFRDGVFRKVRNNRLFIIEAELEISPENRLAPHILVAETPVKKRKDGSLRTESGILDDEAGIEDVKKEKKVFFMKLRHLKDLSLNEYEITEDEVRKIANSSFVAANVCENRAIPFEYKRLMKNDFPFEKAAMLALVSALLLFVLLTLIVGFGTGFLVWLILGFSKFWGLFTIPYFYLVTAAIALFYGIISFDKIRMGRF